MKSAGKTGDLNTVLTVLQTHPQLFMVFFLHVVDDLAFVFERISLFNARHEMCFYHRVRRAVKQVLFWEVLQDKVHYNCGILLITAWRRSEAIYTP